MENNDSASSTNTILIVIVLVLLVGFGVWWFTVRNSASEEGSGINIDVNMPGDNNSSEGTN